MPSSPTIISAPGLARIRAFLKEVGYRFDVVKQRLGLPHYAQWAPDADGTIAPALEPYVPYLGAYLAEAEPRDALDVVIRLVLLNVPVERTAIDRAIPAPVLADLIETGVVHVDEHAAWCPLSLWEIDGLFIATDALQAQEPVDNPVMPLLPECYELAANRLPGEHVLDLCTGSGVHALLASRRAKHVTVVDISARAIAFARFNQALNAIDNATFHHGDTYAPLPADARFDLIVANPPYSPATNTAPGANFYAGGERGDEITARVLAGLAHHLSEHGSCQVIALMTHWKDESFEARLRRQLGEAGAAYTIVLTVDALPFASVLHYLEGLIDADFVHRHVERFEYGMFHLRRAGGGRAGTFHVAPFRAGAPELDIARTLARG